MEAEQPVERTVVGGRIKWNEIYCCWGTRVCTRSQKK